MLPVNTHASIGSVERTDAAPLLKDLVRQARNDQGLTQQELAEKLGMSQRWVSSIETGEIEESKLSTLRKLAAELPLHLEDLVIAARLARTASDARRVLESVPEDDPATWPSEAELRTKARQLIKGLEWQKLSEAVTALEGLSKLPVDPRFVHARVRPSPTSREPRSSASRRRRQG